MKQFVFGLYTEGPTDMRYFRVLLQRYLEQFLSANDVYSEIFDPIECRKQKGDFIDQMRLLAQEYSGLTAIFVHIDADDPSLDTVMDTRWNSWMGTGPEGKWIPVIPIKMLESWMLADREALAKTLIASVADIDDELKGFQPESVPDPKAMLSKIANRGEKRSKLGFEEPRAKQTDFAKLRRLPSFQAFEAVVRRTLIPWIKN